MQQNLFLEISVAHVPFHPQEDICMAGRRLLFDSGVASYKHMRALLYVGAALPPKRSVGIAPATARRSVRVCERVGARARACVCLRAQQH